MMNETKKMWLGRKYFPTNASYALFCILSLFFVFAVFAPEGVIFWKTGGDSDQIMMMIEGASNITEGSYYVTSLIFRGMGPLLYPFMAITGVLTIGLVLIRVTQPLMLAAAVALLYPGLFLGAIEPQKDVLVFFMAAVLILLLSKYRKPSHQYLITSVAYASYGLGIRKYFLLMYGGFLGISVLRRFPGIMLLFIGLFLSVLYFFVPENILGQLQSARDSVNWRRILEQSQFAKTAFMNINQDYSHWSFIQNYAYAFMRLQAPILFIFNIKTIFLQGVVVFCWMLTILGLRKGDATTRLLLRLFIAHQVVLIIFEPDLGSYLRHSLSVVVYLGGAMQLMDAKLLARREARKKHVI